MATNKVTAPFKRGARLTVTDPLINDGKPTDAKYVRWWGVQRSSLVVIEYACPCCTDRPTVHRHPARQVTTHVDSCKVKS